MGSDEAEMLDHVMTTLDTAMIASLAPMALYVGLGGRLLPIWMFLNSMQLVVHLPLLPTNMPGNAHYFLTHYLSYIRLNSQ